MDELLTSDSLKYSKFIFSRADGTIIHSELVLWGNGRIIGHHHENEYFWSFGNGELTFRNRRHEITTRFNTVARIDGRLRFVGDFVPLQIMEWHTLQEVEKVPAIEPRLSPISPLPHYKAKQNTREYGVINDLSEDLRKVLLQSSWCYSQNSGVPALQSSARGIRFKRDGSILNFPGLAGGSWSVNGSNLQIANVSGHVSISIDISRIKVDEGGIRLPSVSSPGYFLMCSITEQSACKIRVASRKIAVLVRTHFLSAKLLNLLDCIYDGRTYDLFVLIDETMSRPSVPEFKTIFHSIGMCADLGLRIDANHKNILWLCGDYALYCAAKQLTEYNYFVMIEYDVHFVRENSLFLDALIQRLAFSDKVIDFMSTIITPEHNKKHDGYAIYPNVYYGGIFSIVGSSRDALDFLFDARLAEGRDKRAEGRMIHCEWFAQTALLNSGKYHCSALNHIVPSCIGSNYHPGRPDLSEPNYILGSSIEYDPRIEILHPVQDAREYLKRVWGRLSSIGEERLFCQHLSELDCGLVSDDVRAEFLALCAGSE